MSELHHIHQLLERIMSKIDDASADFDAYQAAVMAKITELKAKIDAMSVPATTGATDEEIAPLIAKIDAAKAALG